MPHVNNEHKAIVARPIPRLVLKVVIQDNASTLSPGTRLAIDADRTVALGDDDAQVAAQSQVQRSLVRSDMRLGSQT